MSEYTITVTVRETEEGLHVEAQNKTGNGDDCASVFAQAIFGVIQKGVRTLKAEIEAHATAKSSKTIH